MRNRSIQIEDKVDTTIYPMPQEMQPHPVYGFDKPRESAKTKE